MPKVTITEHGLKMTRWFLWHHVMACVLRAGVSYSADFLSLCVLVHLLWPTRSYFYFNADRLSTRVDLSDLGYTGVSLLRRLGV